MHGVSIGARYDDAPRQRCAKIVTVHRAVVKPKFVELIPELVRFPDRSTDIPAKRAASKSHWGFKKWPEKRANRFVSSVAEGALTHVAQRLTSCPVLAVLPSAVVSVKHVLRAHRGA